MRWRWLSTLDENVSSGYKMEMESNCFELSITVYRQRDVTGISTLGDITRAFATQEALEKDRRTVRSRKCMCSNS